MLRFNEAVVKNIWTIMIFIYMQIYMEQHINCDKAEGNKVNDSIAKESGEFAASFSTACD